MRAKGKEIRIRNLTVEQHQSIAVHAAALGLKLDDFCKEASLMRCARRERQLSAAQAKRTPGFCDPVYEEIAQEGAKP